MYNSNMPETKTGIHRERVNGQNYTINIPYRASQGERVPLILMLHWGGPKFRWMGRGMIEDLGLPALSPMEAIIVAPDRRRSHWAKPRAVEDIAWLIDYLEEHYPLDPGKRVVAGYSLGGSGVWYLLKESPDLFPCGVAMAASVPDDLDPGDWKSPIYLINGEFDENIYFPTNQERASKFIEAGVPLEFHSVPDATHTDIRKYISPLTQTISWMEKIWAS